MNKMIEEIKAIHPDSVCLYKVGTFYHAYVNRKKELIILFNF